MRLNEVLDFFKSYVSDISFKLPNNLSKLIVFGSYARNEQKVSSDLDVALVFNYSFNRKDQAFIRAVLNDFNDNLDIDIVSTNIENLKTCNEKDVNYWIREEGVIVWER